MSVFYARKPIGTGISADYHAIAPAVKQSPLCGTGIVKAWL